MQVVDQYAAIPLPPVRGPVQVPTGIVVSITPADPTYPIEVYRAPDNGSGAPDVGNAVLLDSRLFLAHGDYVVDQRLMDASKWFYRWRHVVAGGTAGGYTAWIWARPTFLPQTLPKVQELVVPLRSMPLADGQTNLAAQDATGQTAPASVYVPSGSTVVVGTASSPASLTKTIRVPFSLFMPVADVSKWDYSKNYASPSVISVNLQGMAAIIMPVGVTITGLAARMDRVHVGDSASLDFGRAVDGTYTSLATLTHSGTGWSTVSASISESVGSNTYIAYFTLQSSVLQNDTRFAYLDITYTMPSYDKGY